MRTTTFAALGLLLAGCPSVTPAPEAVEELPETVEPAPEVEGICTLDTSRPASLFDAADDFMPGALLRGAFRPFEADTDVAWFELEDGGVHELRGSVLQELAAAAPEVAAGAPVDWWADAHHLEIGLEGSTAFSTPGGELLYQVNYNIDTDPPAPLWEGSVLGEESVCGMVLSTSLGGFGCNEFAQKRPVRFARDDTSFLLYEGQSAVVDGFEFTLHQARTYSGAWPEDKCPQAEYQWTIVRAE